PFASANGGPRLPVRISSQKLHIFTENIQKQASNCTKQTKQTERNCATIQYFQIGVLFFCGTCIKKTNAL
ncbi:MAG: hypothetical protein IJK24_01770, partial [Oscillospiraceae bacterium]|nr:hypothetical protein [Oscillospiraceae bacterium]